jgi:hypothetical protein
MRAPVHCVLFLAPGYGRLQRGRAHFFPTCLPPPAIPVAVAVPPMPVATPIPWRVGIYWPRNSGRRRNHRRCVIARHRWSCIDRSWHHVDWRWRINRDCIDRRCRVGRWRCRRCISFIRWRQVSDRICVAVVRSYINLGRCASR